MNDAPWYKREFPNFDRDLPSVPGFEDHSWHNDTSPKLGRPPNPEEPDELDLVIWCDYADPALREYPDGKLYLLQDVRDWRNPVDLLESDSLEDIIDAVARFDVAT